MKPYEVRQLTTKYHYSVTWSDKDSACLARVAEFPSLTTNGPGPVTALAELLGLVEVVIGDMADHGEPIPKPIG